jgi:hypothetical protein
LAKDLVGSVFDSLSNVFYSTLIKLWEEMSVWQHKTQQNSIKSQPAPGFCFWWLMVQELPDMVTQFLPAGIREAYVPGFVAPPMISMVFLVAERLCS